MAEASQNTRIALKGVGKRFGSLQVFQDINLEFGEREIVTVVGPSGCGKTTLLRCIDGLIPHDEGEILIEGEEVTQPREGVAMVFQHFGLFPWKTVYKNVAYGLKLAGASHEVITVPGALEIPAAIAIAIDAAEANGKPYDAAIALGCVVRGDTIHFEIVSQESSRGLMDLAVSRKFPLGNGILTVNTEAQAWARARASELNKGGDAARAAIAMLRIKRRLAKA